MVRSPFPPRITLFGWYRRVDPLYDGWGSIALLLHQSESPGVGEGPGHRATTGVIGYGLLVAEVTHRAS